jgi:hypothetical protein
MKLKHVLGTSFLLVSLLLMGINIYGLFQSIRPNNLSGDNLRFENDEPLIFPEVLLKLDKLPRKNAESYQREMTKLVSEAVAHIHWNEELDPTKFNQLVPIWENYILFFMGKLSGIPEYQKYHFIDYKKSLKRGIGLCGDSAMIGSQLLSQQAIPNQIISLKKHVVLSSVNGNGNEITLDPDYGVVIPLSMSDILAEPALVTPYYLQAGYSQHEAIGIQSVYEGKYQRWDGVQHFVTKKYYFEYMSYILKWLIPLIGISFSIWLILKSKAVAQKNNL